MKEGIVPDWVGFVQDALKKRWKIKSTKLRLEIAILDVYGKEYLDRWKVKWEEVVVE